MKSKVKRLASDFSPKHYDLQLSFADNSETFQGSVVITGQKVGRPSFRLTFHQKDLKIEAAQIIKHDKNGDKNIPVSRINRQRSFDEVRLHTEERLVPGKYTVKINFSGKVTEQMHGVYPCNFEIDGKKRKIIATQFESHHAREVFPCIDEPAAKAAFDLTLVTPEGQTMLANTPIKSQDIKDGFSTTVHETTPIMSTYLLAFLFGELKYVESKTKSGVTVRTYATPDKVEQTEFALGVAVKTLDFFEGYFKIKFPLPKCDLVALPDFASGAMENWGLITFRETTLLVDPEHSAHDTKQYVAQVIAHELAHQWFGNLVTMEWWTDLWLNEGFASWVEYLAVDKLFPDWRIWDQFVANEYLGAMSLDSLEYTHPIEVEVPDPSVISRIFDAISYNKGASVIRMLHTFLGPEVFQQGLAGYLEQYKYGNAKTEDLWRALENSSGKPVREFMSAWTSQPGFPVLKVRRRGNELVLKQSRYFINPKQRGEKDGALWPVAINVDGEMRLISEQTNKLTAPKDIATLNPARTGFYMIDYEEAVEEIAARLYELDPLERLGLLNDTFQLTKSGDTQTEHALNLLKKYGEEDNLVVWQTLSIQLGSIARVFDDAEIRKGLRTLTSELIDLQLKRLGWEEDEKDTHFDLLLRPLILGLGIFARRKEVMDHALQLYESAKQPQDIPADLRGVVFGAAAKKLPQSFGQLLDWYKKSRSAEDRDTLAGALTSYKQLDHTNHALNLIQSEHVRLQDAFSWLIGLFGNRHAKVTAWTWLRNNWDWLDAKLSNDISFGRLPVVVGRSFSEEKMIKEYDDFFASVKTPGISRGIAQGHETLEWQTAWRLRDHDQIKAWLSKQ